MVGMRVDLYSALRVQMANAKLQTHPPSLLLVVGIPTEESVEGGSMERISRMANRESDETLHDFPLREFFRRDIATHFQWKRFQSFNPEMSC